MRFQRWVLVIQMGITLTKSSKNIQSPVTQSMFLLIINISLPKQNSPSNFLSLFYILPTKNHIQREKQHKKYLLSNPYSIYYDVKPLWDRAKNLEKVPRFSRHNVQRPLDSQSYFPYQNEFPQFSVKKYLFPSS